MGKSATPAKQADLINPDAPPAMPPSAAAIMKAGGWRREKISGNTLAWRKDDACGDYFLISAEGTTDADPAAAIWTGARINDSESVRGGDHPPAHEIDTPAPLAQIVAEVLALPRLAPASSFSPLEALRNLVLFHDGDADFLAANRDTIADMPFGETSFQESLWQVARDVVNAAASNPTGKEPRK